MVDEEADEEIITIVYRKLAQRYHPDVDPSPEAQRRMVEINEARATLRDPERRTRWYKEWSARRDRRATDRIVRQQGEVPYGEAGYPTGRPYGSLIDFGQYSGWTLGQIHRRDPDYLEWFMRTPAGRRYRQEIEALLRRRTS